MGCSVAEVAAAAAAVDTSANFNFSSNGRTIDLAFFPSLRVSTDLEHTENTNLALLLSVNQSQRESTSLFVLTDSMSERHQQHQHQQVSAKCADFLSSDILSALEEPANTLLYSSHANRTPATGSKERKERGLRHQSTTKTSVTLHQAAFCWLVLPSSEFGITCAVVAADVHTRSKKKWNEL